LFAIAPIWWPPNHYNRELDWSFPEQFTGNAYLIAALVAVVLLITRRPQPVADADPLRQHASRN
jgi:alpha-1,2-mannosyltransferase